MYFILTLSNILNIHTLPMHPFRDFFSPRLSFKYLCKGQIARGGWSFFFLYIFLQCIFFLVGRSVVFGSTKEVFLDNSIFSLTACHCLSAHGNKSFSICHCYLPLHLLLILHCFFPPCFPRALSFFLLFLLFFSPDIRPVLDFLAGCIFKFCVAFGCFFYCPWNN